MQFSSDSLVIAACGQRASLAERQRPKHNRAVSSHLEGSVLRAWRTLLPALLCLCLQPMAAGGDDAPLQVVALALFKDMAVLRIDGQQRTLKVGHSSPEGVTLLSADAHGARVRAGTRELDLEVGAAISFGAPLSSAGAVVRLVPAEHGHYFVDGQINGSPVRFLIDTGASSVAMNKHTARRLGISYAVDGTRGAVQTAAGVVTAYAVTLKEVKVQSLRLTRVAGAVIDGDYPSEPLLGQSFLNRLDLHREGAVLELRER
jgi:aspartyl protease family protein